MALDVESVVHGGVAERNFCACAEAGAFEALHLASISGVLARQGAGTGVGLRPAPAVADVADEPPRNGRLLPVKRAGACTAEVRGSNPLGSTIQSRQTDLVSRVTKTIAILVG